MHLATDLERVASLSEEDLERQMSNIKQELTDIYSGKVINWRKELLEKGSCQQYPYLRKQDLAFNVHVASFTDEQLNIVLSRIQEFFPKANVDIATKVLIPEACLLIVRDVLGIPYQKAEKFVCNPQHYHIPSFKRRAGSTDDSKVLTKKQKVHKYSTTATSSPTHDECVISYKGTVSPNQMKRFERPQYVLENDDKDTILKGQMLTDRHIMMAQSLFKIQFPEIDGLLSPTLGPAGQFPPIPNVFVQIVSK